MKILRWIPAALALMAGGCILTSGQFLVNFDLGTIHVTSPIVVARAVDLNTIGEYKDHKDDLKGLADLAVLGVIQNNDGSNPIGVEVWITPNSSNYTTEAEVKANGVRLWGPFQLAAGVTKRVDWDTSAGLFDPLGKVTLLNEVKGDGTFTLYAVGTAGTYDFTVTEGSIVLVIDAGI
jgi:hypothetical protein